MSKYPGRVITDLAPAGYSVAFDGTGDYLSVADNTALDMGSSDFTIEFWTYLVGTPSTYQAYFAKRANTGTYGGVELYLTSGRTLNLQATLNGSSWGVDITTTSTVPFNTWTHIAAVRNGNTWVVYVNGTAGATSGTVSGTVPDNANTFVIGAGASDGSHVMVASYISNFRVVKGTALYTAAFTPPTQLFNITNTSLLTCNSPAIVDQSTNNFTITANGNAAVSTLTPFPAYVPYNPALGASTPGIWTVDEAMQAAATRQWNMYDPNFQTTTLLLHGNGANNANNNTFLDSSSNNFTITRFGNTTQGTFSPFSQTGWSNYFDGSSNLVSAANSAFSFAGDFTIELWIYPLSLAIDKSIWVIEVSSGSNTFFAINATTTSVAVYLNSGSISFTATPIGGIPLNSWSHIALVRSGSTVTLYVNGVAASGTGTSSATLGSSTTTFRIGGFVNTALNVCYISNFRAVNGRAVYTTNFSVPAAPLGATTGGQNPPTGTQTSLLTCQSNRFADNGGLATPNTLSVNGTPSVQAFSPFYPTVAYTPQTIGGSGYFDGSSDYLAAAGNAAFAFGTGDFTLEAWIYPNSISTGTFDRVCATSDFSGSGFDWTLNTGSSSLFLASSSYGFAINTRSWNHIVYTRSGTTLRGFLNGRLASYNTGVSQNITSTTALQVGQGYSGTGYNGYMTDLRIIKGSIPTTYQTSSTTTGTQIFTPPAAPLTTVSQGATAGNVSCLLNYTNAGVVDSTAKSLLETVADARISTAVSRFGGSSIFFDGTGDSLATAPSQLFNLGFSDFTIEFWVYPTSFAVTSTPLYSTSARAKTDTLAIQISTGGIVYAYVSAAGGATWSIMNAGNLGTVTLNAWNHVAFVRNGSSWRGYVNGVQGPLSTSSSSAVSAFDGFNIGTDGAGGQFYTGYIDDLRITRFARYTAAFTPQTSQWQDQ